MLGPIKKEQDPDRDEKLEATIAQIFPASQPSPTKLPSLGSPHGGHGLKIPVESLEQRPATPGPTATATGRPRELTEAEKLVDRLRQGKGIDWLNSKQEDKERFLKMLVEAGNKSQLMRNLLQEIVAEQNELRYVPADLHTQRTGTNLVDSFTYNTINLGDLEFFPETPGVQTPWEMTRGEHLMHVLAERRALYKDPKLSNELLRFPSRVEKMKENDREHRMFTHYHHLATQQHNAYREEQGQPRQISERYEDNRGRAVLEYEGGTKQVLELDEKGRPLKKSFRLA